ncbi:hypothetical protein DVH24_042210 [Malus domestica]|uniref:Uncharacterized protein n=1 Tax=Malus domestica TaxID=3750 RepID=A0A498IXH8_MALDO|nr:hypothetical protein DVH24_042210 [Malus domestica]
MLERPRRCCEGTAMGREEEDKDSGVQHERAQIIEFIRSATGSQTATAGIDHCPGHGRGLRVILLQLHLRMRLHRLKSTLSGDEVALPVAAEEAFTGVLDSGKGQMNAVAEEMTY